MFIISECGGYSTADEIHLLSALNARGLNANFMCLKPVGVRLVVELTVDVVALVLPPAPHGGALLQVL